MEIDRNTLESIHIPNEYEKYYNDRTESFLRWLEQDFNIELVDTVIESNKNVGLVINRGHLADLCVDDSLGCMGYEYFHEFDAGDFEENIGNNRFLINAIIEGKIFIGYINDFKTIVIASLRGDYTYRTIDDVN